MKSCVDCWHYTVGDDSIYCFHPANRGRKDVVSGGTEILQDLHEAREETGHCGLDGKHWRPDVLTSIAMLFGKRY